VTTALRLLTLAATFAEIVLRAAADGCAQFAESVTAQQLEAPMFVPDALVSDS
jgi:hypothetical protein